ncbi:hypothetical protein [Agrobacterium bohemicum]|uniref:Uncharacterized protein n=1 Tax=Agrobacterium bohemicum TaxID=2052828 RepID=A0A135P7P0_9HYPH|nr:hypothetical protein [Agrobacterium bohemicum]KXG87444.1 hypothetical protein ATO67_19245 [Agrobacterium bohemicum]
MSRFNDIEAALLSRMRALKAKPEKTINFLDLCLPLGDAGFTRNEIMEVLSALEQEKIIAFSPGNRLLILKKLPV